MQTRNDARIVISGSMEAFSNTFMQATEIETKLGEKWVHLSKQWQKSSKFQDLIVSQSLALASGKAELAGQFSAW